ncbi:MAG TPA: hypothetical protein VGB61_00545 [Pyrinomonadaceae bacterium]|jgi:predicted ATP-dependent protease
MNGAEMERAIEFLLQSQANLEAQIAETDRIVAETGRSVAETGRSVAETGRIVAEMNRFVQLQAETQSEFIQIVTRHIEAQGEINASLRASVRELTSAQLRTGEQANKTDERLDRIAAMLERHIVEGHGHA